MVQWEVPGLLRRLSRWRHLPRKLGYLSLIPETQVKERLSSTKLPFRHLCTVTPTPIHTHMHMRTDTTHTHICTYTRACTHIHTIFKYGHSSSHSTIWFPCWETRTHILDFSFLCTEETQNIFGSNKDFGASLHIVWRQEFQNESADDKHNRPPPLQSRAQVCQLIFRPRQGLSERR